MPIPYLKFQGCCEEAVLLYADVFDGHVEHMSRYSEATGGSAVAGKVMHAEVSLGAYGQLSGGDYEQISENTNAIELLIHCPSSAEAERICSGLADGGVYLQNSLRTRLPTMTEWAHSSETNTAFNG